MTKQDESTKDKRTDDQVLDRIQRLASEAHGPDDVQVRPPEIVESYKG